MNLKSMDAAVASFAANHPKAALPDLDMVQVPNNAWPRPCLPGWGEP